MEAARTDERYYTYADYAGWDTAERYELIDGVPYLMSPAPSPDHQKIVLKLGAIFNAFLEDGPCEVFIAPVDVRLNAGSEDDTVLQPDILIVCDDSKIGDRSINGAPDVVVEVLSPSSEKYDSGAKLDKYLEAGVRECWIINPEAHTVRIYHGNKGADTSRSYREADTVKSEALRSLVVPLAGVFTTGRPAGGKGKAPR
jgi:Uma2 family endonuclease